MSIESDRKAEQFINGEKEFHLGFLPTEQSHPLTSNLDLEFARATVDGVKNLQSVDRCVLDMAKRVFASEKFGDLIRCGLETVRSGRRIIFSGCGATGRLSILLECMWRRCCAENPKAAPYADQVYSIMTGGDYALVRSVEFFEDYQSFGRRQLQDLNGGPGDLLVAITEGGETSSVLGTLFEAVDRGMKAFLLFNNPADVLAEKLARSRKAIRDPRVCVLDLFCGPMALAGSTRMQATTSEQLIAGGALEIIMDTLLGAPRRDYAAEFEKLLGELESAAARKAIAEYIDFEAEIYRRKGLVTYFAGEYLLDIFTDTTERSPTFMLPPFRKKDDAVSPRPWAFVKDPTRTTPEVWRHGMNRPLRCLTWSREDYLAMGAPEKVLTDPPQISANEMLKFETGKENPQERIATGNDAAVLILANSPADAPVAKAFRQLPPGFAQRRTLTIGGTDQADFSVPCTLRRSSLEIMTHLAVKLVLNTVSTGIMTVLGRVTGNWMSWVDISNKKLIDRAVRLISEIGKLSYEESCRKLFAAAEELEQNRKLSEERHSVVQHVLKKL